MPPGAGGCRRSPHLGLLWLYYTPSPKLLFGDEDYYFRLAEQIAAGQPAVHHPFWPPLYAEALGKLFAIFGATLLSLQVVQISMWLLSGLLYASIGCVLFQSRRVGVHDLWTILLPSRTYGFLTFCVARNSAPVLFRYGAMVVYLHSHPVVGADVGWRAARLGLAH